MSAVFAETVNTKVRYEGNSTSGTLLTDDNICVASGQFAYCRFIVYSDFSAFSVTINENILTRVAI